MSLIVAIIEGKVNGRVEACLYDGAGRPVGWRVKSGRRAFVMIYRSIDGKVYIV